MTGEIPFWNQYIQMLDVMSVSFIINYIVIIRTYRERVNKSLLLLAMLIKLFLINGFINVWLFHFYKETAWFQRANIPVNALLYICFILSLLYTIHEPLRKIVFLFQLSDLFSLLLSFLSLKGIYLITGENLARMSTHSFDYLNIIIILLQIVTYYLLWHFGEPIFRKLGSVKLKKKFVWDVYAAGYLLVGFYLQIAKNVSDTEGFPGPGILISMGLVLTAFLIVQYLTQKQVARENQYLKSQQILMEEHYDAMKKYIVQTRKFRHDIANHMDTIEEITRGIENSSLDDYLLSLKAQYEELKQIDYCDNLVVDAVIRNKLRRCEDRGIKADIEMQGFRSEGIEDIDLMEIITNLFDNAIEACEKVSDSTRWIHLKAAVLAGQLIIKVSNSSPEVVIRNNRLRTSKEDYRNHGVGLTIVKDLVAKYQGSMELGYENGSFQVQIMLPV